MKKIREREKIVEKEEKIKQAVEKRLNELRNAKPQELVEMAINLSVKSQGTPFPEWANALGTEANFYLLLALYKLTSLKL